MTLKVVKFICGLIVIVIMFLVYGHMNTVAEEYKKKGNNSLTLVMNLIFIENLILLVYFWGSLSDD
jgi:hypothetical protein